MAGRTLAEVYVSVRGETSQLSGDIHQGIRRVDTKSEGTKAGHSYGSAFGSSAKRVIGGIGGLVAAAGIGRVIKESVSGFREHQQVVAQTNAALASTKGAAHIGAAAVGQLSDALERKTTIDGDQIQSGANMLLTFRNIRNETGKGNDVFNQATKTLLDMSVATGTDAPKAAIQLGKALNDPIKGMSALSRVGVTFDGQQIKQITTMQKAGNIAGAQKVILAELNTEFKNSAGAQGAALGAQGRLTVAWRQAQDTIGAALLPVVNELEGALADRLPGAADRFAKAVQQGQYGVEAFFRAFQEGDVTSGGFVGVMEQAGVAVRNLNAGFHDKGPVEGFSGSLNTLGLGVRALIRAYQEGDVTSDGFIGKMEQIGVSLGHVRDYLKTVDFHKLAGDAKEVGSSLSTVDVKGFAQQLQSVDTSHFADGLNVLGAGLGFVADHIGLVVKALPVLLVGYAAYKASEAAANVAALTSLPIKAAQVVSNFALAKSIRSLATGNIEQAVATGGATGAEVVKTAVTGVGTAATQRGTFATLASAVAQKTVAAATKVWAGVQFVLNAVLTANPIGLIIIGIAALIAIVVIIATKTDWFQRLWRLAWGAITTAVSATFNWIKTNWPLILAIITGPIGLAVLAIVRHWDTIKSTASTMLGGLKTIWQNSVRFLALKFLDMVGTVLNGVAHLFGWVKGVGPKLRDAASEFNKFRDRVNTALGGVKSRNVKVSATLQGLSASRAAAEFATGGPVFGAGTATSDSIPAMLSAGEHVLTAKEVRAFGGHDAVMAMRKEAVRGFAAGGPVDFKVSPQLIGMAKFQRAIAAFNARVDAMARKLALAGGGFSANLAGVVNFAKAQVGAHYSWGSSGPKFRGYDCSGFLSNLVEVAKGLPLYRRLFATGSIGSYPWINHFGGAFKVGWMTARESASGVGHTAATVNGVNMESRGSDGVVVGARSRGANQGIFRHHAFLAAGGPVLPGDPPFDLLDPRGRYFNRGLVEQLQAAMGPATSFDSGGSLPARSVGIWRNGTGRPERVRSGVQEDALAAELRGLRRDLRNLPIAQVDDRYVRRTQRYMGNRDPSGW